MPSMHFIGALRAEPSAGRAGAVHKPHAQLIRFAVIALVIVASGMLSACSSGSGGDNGAETPRSSVTPQGLTFTYPFNGQTDVVPDTTMIVDFAEPVSGDVSDAFALQVDGDDAGPTLSATQDNNQPNIIRLSASADLLPNTRYDVVATNAISGGNTAFSAGDRIFSFVTRPPEGTPAEGDFEVTTVTPGDTNPVTGESTIFTQFNAIRVVFNEPLDPSTVDDDSFIVTGPDGNQITTSGADAQAKLTALGRYIVFDPVTNLLPVGDYTVAWTSDIVSQFGKSLDSGSVNRSVLSVGNPIAQTLTNEITGTDIDDLPDDILDGNATNNVNISSQLIGSNDQPSVGPDDDVQGAALTRTSVKTMIATPGQAGFGDVLPAVIPAGQKFQLKGLSLSLNGDIQTPIDPSGLIDVNFINDVDVYLMANDYRNIETPTAVRLRFDLGIGTLITADPGSPESIVQSVANGVFNQSALNIQAAGLAVPRDNGDLVISTLGTFPINVNRTGDATVDFQLTLVLPADSNDQIDQAADQVPPIITAQVPSACLYAFGSPAYIPFYTQAPPTAFPEAFCIAPLNGNPPPAGGLGVAVNSFPIESNPAIVFSKPIDPASVNASSIQLSNASGNVPATYRVEGFSVVVDPVDLLQPNTQYTLRLNNSSNLTDLVGNAVSFQNTLGPGQTITFTTEPQVDDNPTPPLLGELSPGMPCALEGGDFDSGGDTAGHCVGDDPGGDGDDSSSDDFAVFQNPANVPVNAYFSKLVDSDSIVLADGCLTSGSGDSNDNDDATVAVQEMDGSGQCAGAVPGDIAFANRGDELTRGFSFRPEQAFTEGTRYWIVVCGTDSSSCSNQIMDANGAALNTDPLNGTGSIPIAADDGDDSDDDDTDTVTVDVAGGPDIVMPFDAIAASDDYYADTFALPETDTNGNGQFDDADGDGAYTPGDSEERPQPGNRVLVNLALLGTQIMNANRDDGLYPAYLSQPRPIAIRSTLDDCSVTSQVTNDDGDSAIGSTPDQCIQVSLLPGGFNALTGIGINVGAEALPTVTTAVATPIQDAAAAGTPLADIPTLGPLLVGAGFQNLGAAQMAIQAATVQLLGLPQFNGDGINTGRLLLRFPNEQDDTDTPQSGYIVPACEGTLNGVDYDYEPCFVASLRLTANGPDAQGVVFAQQPVPVSVIGPVTFEQNGRLVIALRNVNTFTLSATALELLPATATVAAGNLNFQLVGSVPHGGRAFPNR